MIMVRVNIINPKYLADQHLVAEYNEILMLVAYIKKYPSLSNIPIKYCLGKGHMKFFKNKVLYLAKRHETLKKEMNKRVFIATKKIKLSDFRLNNKKDWKACSEDKEVIKKRLIEKLKLKPEFYRHYGTKKSLKFFLDLVRQS
jgi:deoxyribonuclease (pyrimidine dimer)